MAKARNDDEMCEPGSRGRPRCDDGHLRVAAVVDPIAAAGGGQGGRRATSGAGGKKSPAGSLGARRRVRGED
jgi:hypothetical protein